MKVVIDNQEFKNVKGIVFATTAENEDGDCAAGLVGSLCSMDFAFLANYVLDALWNSAQGDHAKEGMVSLALLKFVKEKMRGTLNHNND